MKSKQANVNDHTLSLLIHDQIHQQTPRSQAPL